MKLFQIEEPDGSPVDSDVPGVPIGIGATSGLAEVAVAIGGNSVRLVDRDGFERALMTPDVNAGAGAWQDLFEGARLRAERSLSRPVTHAVLALPAMPGAELSAQLHGAAERAGLSLLRVIAQATAEEAACLAEDLSPQPMPGTGSTTDTN